LRQLSARNGSIRCGPTAEARAEALLDFLEKYFDFWRDKADGMLEVLIIVLATATVVSLGIFWSDPHKIKRDAS
jgi:hypothetical protein